MAEALKKVDSAGQGNPEDRMVRPQSPPPAAPAPRRACAAADLGFSRRKINTSPSSIDDKDILKKLLTKPAVKKIDLHFPLGLEVTARNLKGVTIKDALDAIHKPYKKRVSRACQGPPGASVC